MKKRILSFLLALTMVWGMLPAAAFAAGSVTTISTADDLIALGGKTLTGSYELGGDIDMSGKTMSPITSLSGSFDGKGHTIKGLSLTGASNVGLFAEAKGSTTIQNVLLENCVVQNTGSPYSYYGIGMLVGKASGTIEITNCSVCGGSVEASSDKVYVGGLVGYGSSAVTIKNCFSTAEVTGNYHTGGIIGSVAAGSMLENCYVRGFVTTKGASTGGGLVGYIYIYSGNVSFKNCYSAASVSGSKAYVVVYNYSSNKTTFENCYYDSEINTGINACYVANTNVIGKTTAELKALANTLGDEFQNDVTPNLNGGYPILSWQYVNPDDTYTVSFTVEPKEAVLTWDGTVQDMSENGKYTFDNVAVGNYDYSVACEDGDYAAQSGTVTVKNKAVSTAVRLELNKHTLTFDVTPADAVLTVRSGDTELKPTAAGGRSYTVTKGTYTYTAEAFGYVPVTDGSVTVGMEDKEETVTLTAQPAVTVTFSYADGKTDVTGGKLVVTTGTGSDKRTMTAQEGSDGMVYVLPVGYSYDWTFTSGNYKKQTDTVDLTSTTEVTIPMTAKIAWEGGDDITEPAKDTEGVYQITSGSELAWLAREVNEGRGASYNAVLCKDIDLDNENWTPIGKYSRNAYKGTFDGQGFKVENLSITGSTSANYGLFGYVNGGTVKNVAVSGEIALTGTGSSSYGAAGIVGSLTGNGATVENCINKAKITGQQNVGGIVGYISGGSGSEYKYVTSCVNTGEISSNSNNAGGIVGYINGQVTVDSCYNRGKISSGNYRAGGIAAYMNSGYAKVQNCYSTGAISVTNGTDAKSIVGNKSSGTLAGSYYLDGQAADANATDRSEADLKDLTQTTLGDAFRNDVTPNINDGYPILKWQIPTYAVTFTVSPETAKVAIEDQTGTQTDGQWTFKLPDGKYNYTVSAFGYQDKTGSVTVSGAAESETVTLTEAAKKTVTFAIFPTDAAARATVTVTWKGETVRPQEDGSYSLPYGTYQYTVKARGYTAVTHSLTVSAASAGTVAVRLEETSAWDGESTQAPSGAGTEQSPYKIENGEELAWLAQQVNGAASGTKFYAKLTGDIDLGGRDWTPIGKDFHEFSGEFDGQGYAVSGLKVSGVDYAGLFGVVKDATIKGVVVKGSVSGSDATGGLVGFAKSSTAAVEIENCGNEAVVTTTGSYVGGLLGKSFASASIKNSYNTGSVSSTNSGYSVYAGGIAGWAGGSDGAIAITDCYNTGKVESSAYAGGILAYDSSRSCEVTNCYSTGTVTGADSRTGALVPGGGTPITNSYYQSGTDSHTEATSFTTLTVDQLGSADTWETVRGINGGLPVLKWQGLTAPTVKATLAENARFGWQSTEAAEDPEMEGGSLLPTGVLTWDAAAGAQQYTVTLWRQTQTWSPLSAAQLQQYKEKTDPLAKLRIADEDHIIARMTTEERAALAQLDDALADAKDALQQLDGTATVAQIRALLAAEAEAEKNRAAYIVSVAEDSELGSYTTEFSWVRDIAGVTGTSRDLSAELAALEEGVYFASVAVQTDENAAVPTLEQAKEKVFGNQYPYNRMKPVTGLTWNGTVAAWDAKSGFTQDQAYQLDVYAVTGTGETVSYTPVKSFTLSGQYCSADLANVFAAQRKYVFTVTALSDDELLGRLGLTDSLPSAYSGVYDPNEGQTAPTDYVEITSASQWIALANVEDVPSTDESNSPSMQKVAWEKNYRLMNDIDFSTLTAEEKARTKSIGNVTYRFTGDFDGNGKKITGLTLSNNDSGLFWYVGATGKIHDLTVDSANVLFSDNAAVLVNNNYGTVENCAVVNANITADTGAVLGGMVSRNYGIIRSSYVQGGSLTSNTTTATGHAGFVGSNEEGGLIERCWTSMDVSTGSSYAGGFVGLGYGGTIRNCFALGDVSARDHSGGFVGRSVYSGNKYENCYAAGVVTVTDEEGNGFIGGNKTDSAFKNDQSEGITNCYYNSATQSTHDYGAAGKSLEEMKNGAFLTLLSGSESGVWAQDADKNDGLPYLSAVKVPEKPESRTITVTLAIASYNKTAYAFEQMGGDIAVTVDSTGNTRLVDLMDAAKAQGKLTYSYTTTTAYGRFIETINGRSVNAPDGWMFTINDILSNESASLATVKDGDKVLWFEGTTENRFQGPTWDGLKNSALTWVDISTEDALRALAAATDAATLGKNYRLTADLTLTGGAFPGIGTADAPFTGIFDGQGHTVSNLTVTASDKDNVGFFGVIKGATVKNLTLTGVNVTGKNKVGGLVGYAQAVLDSADLSKNIASLIGSCSVTGTVTGTESVGGLVGLNQADSNSNTGFSIASAVDKCTADVTVTGQTKVGGLVGDNGGTVTRSSAKGAVTGTGNSSMVGGLAGSSTGDIYESHAEGTVIGKTHTGGFVGSSTGEMKKCYSLGAVTGTDYTGSFAGSLTRADTVIGAGQVTVTGTPANGYNGGFVGNLGGTLTGLSNQITVKNAFGCCVDGLSAVGNASQFSSESQQAALTAMTLDTWTKVGNKLYELFQVNLPGDAADALTNYADTVLVPAGTAVNTVISLLKSGQSAAAGVDAACAVTGEYLTGGSALTLVKANDTAATLSCSATLVLTDSSGRTARKTVQVLLQGDEAKRTALMDAIAGSYTNTADPWAAMDMALYAALPGKTIKLTNEAKQALVNTIIADAAGSGASASDRARYELVLRALRVDSGKLYPVNSNASFSNAAKLAQLLPLNSYDYYSAPWVLLAEQQGNLTLAQTQRQELIALLKDNMGSDGLFGYEWEGVTYTSPDMAGSVLSALARFYDTNADARAVVDTVLANLPSAMDARGSFGSANSDAFVIIGLLAVGQDPAQMKAPSGASVVDGLLSYVNTATDRFQFWGADNDLATEQAFRALAALAMYDGQDPCNIYDFSANSVVPGRATGEGTVVTPPSSTGDNITVTVTIRTDSGDWMSGKSVTVPGEGATVYHAFIKALEGSGITQTGAENGYVRSMTKNGVTLGEFTKGENSGWLYKVNGTLPSVGLTACSIENGNSILWYYTGDWTGDPDAGAMAGTLPTAQDKAAAAQADALIGAIGTVTRDSGPAITAARRAYDALTDAGKKLVSNYAVLTAAEKAFADLVGDVAFEDVDTGSYYYEALLWAVKTGLTKGTSATTFSPDMVCSRGQMVTFLWRVAGEPKAKNRTHPFTDVDESAYYYEALLWAVENGITLGTSGDTFSPDLECSRGQMVVFLYRGASSPAVSGGHAFGDVSDTDYFSDAVVWAAEQQITNGTGAGLFSPDMECSRGQMVTFFYRWLGK